MAFQLSNAHAGLSCKSSVSVVVAADVIEGMGTKVCL